MTGFGQVTKTYVIDFDQSSVKIFNGERRLHVVLKADI